MEHTFHDVAAWIGQDLVGVDGQPVGKIKDIYLDEATEQPEWLAVKTGGFGSGVSFVPLAEAQSHGDGVRVPYAAATIESAPRAKPDGELSQDEEARLYDHYRLVYGESRSGSGPTTDTAMTRSEEELRVGTTVVEVGRARRRKDVVIELVETTVPVQREEVRLEREPITDANVGQATDGPDISEEEHEVVLHEEEVVVEQRVVPKERVRLDKETVTEERAVSEEVRKEQIEAEDGARHG